MTNPINPVIVNGFDVEVLAERLVNGEGYDGMTSKETLAVVVRNDELAMAVYEDISARWGDDVAHKVLIG